MGYFGVLPSRYVSGSADWCTGGWLGLFIYRKLERGFGWLNVENKWEEIVGSAFVDRGLHSQMFWSIYTQTYHHMFGPVSSEVYRKARDFLRRPSFRFYTLQIKERIREVKSGE